MTATRTATIAVVAALAVGGCTGGPSPNSSTPPADTAPSIQPSAVATTPPPAAELSAANPTARFAVGSVGTSRQIRVVIVANTNPARQPLLLSLRVNGIDGGGVAPFPPDQPGSFTIALSPAAAEQVGQGGAVLDITLTPIAAGELIHADVRLRVQAYPAS